jgi:hypothetical protein
MRNPETDRLVQGATPIGLLHRCTTSAAIEIAPKLHRRTNRTDKRRELVQPHKKKVADQPTVWPLLGEGSHLSQASATATRDEGKHNAMTERAQLRLANLP